MDRILKVHFDKFRDQGKLPPELCEDNTCEGMNLFSDEELLKIWQNNRKGISWEDGDGNVLKGAVDNILVKDGKLVVLDYKTRGYDLKENTHEYYQNQLDTYNFLLRKNGYKTEDFAFLLFYVPKEVTPTGEVIFDTTLKKMKISVESAEKIWKKAIEMLNEECPSGSCEWCERF
jgi:hypothetical protein